MNKLGHYHYYRNTRYGKLPSFPMATLKSDDKMAALLQTIFYEGDDGILHDCIGSALNDNIRPELRDYIKNYLLQPHQPLMSRDDISDDELAELHPNENESVESYTSRVRSFVDSLKPKDDKE